MSEIIFVQSVTTLQPLQLHRDVSLSLSSSTSELSRSSSAPGLCSEVNDRPGRIDGIDRGTCGNLHGGVMKRGAASSAPSCPDVLQSPLTGFSRGEADATGAQASSIPITVGAAEQALVVEEAQVRLLVVVEWTAERLLLSQQLTYIQNSVARSALSAERQQLVLDTAIVQHRLRHLELLDRRLRLGKETVGPEASWSEGPVSNVSCGMSARSGGGATLSELPTRGSPVACGLDDRDLVRGSSEAEGTGDPMKQTVVRVGQAKKARARAKAQSTALAVNAASGVTSTPKQKGSRRASNLMTGSRKSSITTAEPVNQRIATLPSTAHAEKVSLGASAADLASARAAGRHNSVQPAAVEQVAPPSIRAAAEGGAVAMLTGDPQSGAAQQLQLLQQEECYARDMADLLQSRDRVALLLQHLERMHTVELYKAWVERLASDGDVCDSLNCSAVTLLNDAVHLARVGRLSLAEMSTTAPAVADADRLHKGSNPVVFTDRSSVILVATPTRTRPGASWGVTTVPCREVRAAEATPAPPADLLKMSRVAKETVRDKARDESRKKRQLRAVLKAICEEAEALECALDSSLHGLKTVGSPAEPEDSAKIREGLGDSRISDRAGAESGCDGDASGVRVWRNAFRSTLGDERGSGRLRPSYPMKVMQIAASTIDELRSQNYKSEEQRAFLEHTVSIAQRKEEKLRQQLEVLQNSLSQACAALKAVCVECHVRLPAGHDFHDEGTCGVPRPCDTLATIQLVLNEVVKAVQVRDRQIEWLEAKNRREENDHAAFAGVLSKQVEQLATVCGVNVPEARKVGRANLSLILQLIIESLEVPGAPREDAPMVGPQASGVHGVTTKEHPHAHVTPVSPLESVGGGCAEELEYLRGLVQQMQCTIDGLEAAREVECGSELLAERRSSLPLVVRPEEACNHGSDRFAAPGVGPAFAWGQPLVEQGVDTVTLVLRRLEETRRENYALQAQLRLLEEEREQLPAFARNLGRRLRAAPESRSTAESHGPDLRVIPAAISPVSGSCADDSAVKCKELAKQLAALKDAHALLREELENEVDEKASLEIKLREAERFIQELQKQFRRLRQSGRLAYTELEYENVCAEGDDDDEDDNDSDVDDNSDEERSGADSMRAESSGNRVDVDAYEDENLVSATGCPARRTPDEACQHQVDAEAQVVVEREGHGTSRMVTELAGVPRLNLCGVRFTDEAEAPAHTNAAAGANTASLEDGDDDQVYESNETDSQALLNSISEQQRIHKRLRATSGIQVAVLHMDMETGNMAAGSPRVSQVACAVSAMLVSQGISLHCFISPTGITQRRVAILYPQPDSHHVELPSKQLVRKLFAATAAPSSQNAAPGQVIAQPILQLCDLREEKLAPSLSFAGSKSIILAERGNFIYVSVPPKREAVAARASESHPHSNHGSHRPIKPTRTPIGHTAIANLVDRICHPELLDISEESRFLFTTCYLPPQSDPEGGSPGVKVGRGPEFSDEEVGSWIPADRIGWVGHRICAWGLDMMHFSSPEERERFNTHLNTEYDLVLSLSEDEVRGFVGGCVEVVADTTKGGLRGGLRGSSSVSSGRFVRKLCLTLTAFAALSVEHRSQLLAWYGGSQNLLLLDLRTLEGLLRVPLRRLMGSVVAHRASDRPGQYPVTNVLSVLRIA